jgi:AcrR family transcriptional regulator
MKPTAKHNRYHHGDLRNALLQAALLILERDGLEGLSLRAVAADVGVSHAAPNHHFGSLRALRNAVAALGYERFAAAIRMERSLAPSTPKDQMRAASRGYLAFATANPALFRLMFSCDLLDWSNGELQQAARLARQQLVDICAPAAARLGFSDEASRAMIENLVWSQIHGRAHLTIDGQVPPLAESETGPDLADLLFSYGATTG